MSEFPPPAELQTGPSLSKDDLVSIVKNSLGLRHDTSETQPHLLEDDQPKDALALASLVGLLPQEVLNTVPNYSDPTWKAFYQGRADYLINLLTPPRLSYYHLCL